MPNKRRQMFQILVITLLFSMILPTTVFAKNKEFHHSITMYGEELYGKLEITNYIEVIESLNGKELDFICIGEYDETSEHKDEIYIHWNNGFIVSNPSKIILKNDYPLKGRISIYKLSKRGEDITYNYNEALPITSGKVEVVDDLLNIYYPNATIDINEPGDYYLQLLISNEMITTVDYGFIRVVDNPQEKDKNMVLPVYSKVAIPTISNVLVNGAKTSFDAYLIEGNNYFKLRDLAYVLSGSEKQFDVKWDGQKSAIHLTSNKPYTPLGEEMTKGDGTKKNAWVISAKIFIDDIEEELLAYTINDNNYFMLRDIAKAFNFGVTWNNETKSIEIDTFSGYDE